MLRLDFENSIWWSIVLTEMSNETVPLLSLLLFLLILEKSQRNSMVLSLRDDNKKCCSISQHWIWQNSCMGILQNWRKMRQIGKWLLLWKHGNTLTSCVKTIFRMDWTTHCIVCIVQSRQQKSCGIPRIRNTRQKMLELKSSLWANFWITKWLIPKLCLVKCKSYR